MRFRRTPLEERLEGVSAEEHTRILRDLWRSFKTSPHFDLVIYILRDLERQALQQIRDFPVKSQPYNGIVLHVVERIRRTFESLDRGPEAEPRPDWFDDEDFVDEQEQRHVERLDGR